MAKKPSLPTDRAFVVQLHADAEVEKGQYIGRVEHMVSGKATHFTSLQALGAFITRVLSEGKAEAG